ncbi:DUF1801 domain-containing protein [Alkalihalobacillus pseudalcaliphilus]|uniref:DUF1801 domain-containing protein n=1 Tax=Alkalihalobacillus pseudalcaliphilus TaxID=79884 RepID=UPI000840C70C|nr:DUF1801 domain-containing protein [Alkalihalobacillus pseudalcaliphilus]
MSVKKNHLKVDQFLQESTEAQKWQKEYIKLREIILSCNVQEEYKWMHPCYTFNQKNIVLIHGFKDYCALLFHKGELLKDPKKILIQQTENVHGARQIRFNNLEQILGLEETIQAYINEAIEVEKAGLVVKKKTREIEIPEELIIQFTEMPELKVAFEALTPGRQRAYLLHFSQPKQSKTKAARIEKSLSRIFAGKGLTDCICGLSKRYPNCDGSHKMLENE